MSVVCACVCNVQFTVCMRTHTHTCICVCLCDSCVVEEEAVLAVLQAQYSSRELGVEAFVAAQVV